MLAQQNISPQSVCLVCGDTARGFNFNVVTCMSCKTFFRRHALKSDGALKCQRNNNCPITVQTRVFCMPCRLRKCFLVGMNAKLIRRYSESNRNWTQIQLHSHVNNNQVSLPISTLNLLRVDNSLLSAEEWSLLSNVTHFYDEANISSRIKYRLAQQAPLPPKIRSKLPNAMGVLQALYSELRAFIELLPMFRSLPCNVRLALLRGNYDIAGTLNSALVVRELDALNNTIFETSAAIVCGDEFVKNAHKYVLRLEPNGILVKIMVSILVFSSNFDHVNAPCESNGMDSNILISVFEIQNRLVTIFWKYLIHKYGFIESVHRYSAMIKFVLDVIHFGNTSRTSEHQRMMETIIEETRQSLVIQNLQTTS